MVAEKAPQLSWLQQVAYTNSCGQILDKYKEAGIPII